MNRHDDEGATAVEYALIAIGVAAIIVLIVFTLGGYTQSMFSNTCTKFDDEGMTNASGDVCP